MLLGKKTGAVGDDMSRQARAETFAHEPDHRGREGGNIAGWDEEPGHLVVDHIDQPIHARADHGTRVGDCIGRDAGAGGGSIGTDDDIASIEPVRTLVRRE